MRSSKRDSLLLLVALLIAPAFFVDKSVLLAVKEFYARNPETFHAVTAVDPVMLFLSNGGTLIAIAILLWAGGRFYRPGLSVAGRTLLTGLISSGLITQVIKHLVGRARPRITLDTIFIGPSFKGGYDSFPSGHTTLAFGFAYVLSAYYPKYRIPFYLFAVLVGIDRIQGFHHFPSDVLGGIIVGSLTGIFWVERESRTRSVTRPD